MRLCPALIVLAWTPAQPRPEATAREIVRRFHLKAGTADMRLPCEARNPGERGSRFPVLLSIIAEIAGHESERRHARRAVDRRSLIHTRHRSTRRRRNTRRRDNGGALPSPCHPPLLPCHWPPWPPWFDAMTAAVTPMIVVHFRRGRSQSGTGAD